MCQLVYGWLIMLAYLPKRLYIVLRISSELTVMDSSLRYIRCRALSPAQYGELGGASRD